MHLPSSSLQYIMIISCLVAAHAETATNSIIKESETLDAISPAVLYDNGVKDYLDNNYDGCIAHLEQALKAYNNYTGKLRRCHLHCHNEVAFNEPLHQVDVENLLHYEKAIKNTLCLLQCKKREGIWDAWRWIDKHVLDLFEKRKPYEYLQACYAHTEQFQQAANAAFTYLVINPNDAGVLASLHHYAVQSGVEANDVVNREAKDYVYLYVHGTRAYEEKQWEEVIGNMEASLESFLQEEQECRAQCEGPFEQPPNDFITSIANHFTHVLVCKRKCNDKLSTLNGEKHDDLLPSHYHYLQYAYFKVGKLKEACRAVSSYLLFYPADKTMMHNMEYYSTLPKFQKDFFLPRLDAEQYILRHAYESKIMDFITNVFAVETAKLHQDPDMKENVLEENVEQFPTTDLFSSKSEVTKRFVQKHFATAEECRQLLHIAEYFALPGDGYQTGGGSPHTVHENYYGLSLKRAVKLSKRKQMDVGLLSLLVNVTENVKRAVEQRFDVTKRLHFAYTHLVCRSAKSAALNRTDFSHPVHADNCNLQLNLTCPKNWPAFTWRDYTAILYLNDESDAFTGGEFFFSKDYFGTKVEHLIKPRCGKLVGFTSGGENLHGVRAITEGRRCALAIWFTHDQHYAEERRFLYNVLIPNK